MKPTETKRLLRKAIDREKNFIEGCKTSSQRENPIVIQQRIKAEGRLDALESTLDALQGDNVCLRILAGE